MLRNLSLATRLTLAAFLVSVGLGYCSALVQVHFQHAKPGNALPSADDAVAAFHGSPGVSQLERLLLADEGKPFNGSGSMRETFTTISGGWKAAIKRRAKEKNIALDQAETELRREREGEILAVVDWIRAGAKRETYEGNNHPLSAHLFSHPISPKFVENDTGTVSPGGTPRVKVASIFETRCVRCHSEAASGRGAQFPLDDWEQIRDYCEGESNSGGMSVKKLAQSTHVHLLGFAMLYCLTGLIFTFSSYPGWLRAPLGVLPLVAQVADIGCWWLARLDAVYAPFILYTGAAVALGLALQIVLSLFNMFGRTGKVILFALILAGVVGGSLARDRVIEPFLARERARAALAE
jgi:hypothetical protein